MDNRLREKYWYYLTRAVLIYRAQVERGDTYQFLAIYRNIVGTFLAITTWKNQSKEIEVNTLVRLGNGYEKDSGALYKPVSLRGLQIKYALGQGEYLIDCDDSGNVAVNGKVLSNNLNDNLNSGNTKSDTKEQLVEKCKEFATAAAKKFWYYLDQARVIYSSVARTNARDYCLITYLNIAGTFLVLGNQDQTSKAIQINTFVRLGNGFDDSQSDYKPVNFTKAQLYLVDFEE